MTPLFVPATHPERIAKAAKSGADAIFVDLEDAVPVAQKEAARRGLAGALENLDKPLFIRVNATGTPWFEDDIAFAKDAKIDGIVLPKTQSAAEIKDLPDNLKIVGLIESALGIAALAEICCAPNLSQLAFGSIDYALDLDCAEDRDALLLARLSLVTQSRARNLPAPLDGVSVSIENLDLVHSDSFYARQLGFGGKMCIHPRQISTVQNAFLPTADDIAWAKRVKAAEVAGGKGALQLDGKMIDAPVLARANRILMEQPNASDTITDVDTRAAKNSLRSDS